MNIAAHIAIILVGYNATDLSFEPAWRIAARPFDSFDYTHKARVLKSLQVATFNQRRCELTFIYRDDGGKYFVDFDGSNLDKAAARRIAGLAPKNLAFSGDGARLVLELSSQAKFLVRNAETFKQTGEIVVQGPIAGWELIGNDHLVAVSNMGTVQLVDLRGCFGIAVKA